MEKEDIEREAMRLLPDERAELAKKLLLSLEDELVQDIEAEWVAEACRRAALVDQGDVALIPADRVHRKAAGLL